jgi:UDP-N-acetylglucosamine--N-acetylmuramyl-(pentapeptide) pyrophosphoryl-undecaprenol N-acetylglucosamine transferase
MRIIFTGGGTAGHVYPLLSIIREMKKNYPFAGFEFMYLGPKDKFVKSVLAFEGVKVKTVLSGKYRRYFSIKNIFDIFKMPIGIIQAFYYVFVFSPDLIFSKGGYGSIPTALAGWFLQTPIFLHESDVIPGLANRIASRFAVEIFISFSIQETEYFPSKKMLSVGNPIRIQLLDGSEQEAKRVFSLTGEKPVILITGGSLGAQRINDKILSVLPEMLNDFEVIHQTGEKNFKQVQEESKVVLTENARKYYHPVPFMDVKNMAHALKTADLIISRAGSGSIFEIAAAGKPSILVPLEGSAQDHQVRNAYAVSQRGAALVIEEPNFRPHFVLERIKFLFSNPDKMKDLAQRAKEFARPYAARVISEYLMAYLSQ